MDLEKRDSFIIYNEYYELIKELPTEHKGLLLTAFFEYQINGVEIDLPQMARVIFKFIQKRMDYNNHKYRETCQRNKINGAKGGRPKGEEIQEPTGIIENPKNPVGYSETQMNPKNPNEPYTDTDIKIDIDKETDSKLERGCGGKPAEVVDNVDKSKALNRFMTQFAQTHKISSNFKKQFYVSDSFSFDMEDPNVKPYVNEFGEQLIRDVERWLIKEKTGKTVDMDFICRQFINFAKKQGIYG